ncbi:MAG: hypothetical protein BZY81_02965 [SAR202 cluster bacterium Io17-Chloro-G4]|nr:MAG: hypothetical protein BZY81_02965 [SAR202 cluster bacterium Io17-Chloro-G4]
MQDGVSLTDARAVLTHFPEMLGEGQGVVPLTRHGKPVLAIMTWDLFESLSETIAILSDSELVDQIRKGMKDIEEGRTRSWEEVKAKLNL